MQSVDKKSLHFKRQIYFVELLCLSCFMQLNRRLYYISALCHIILISFTVIMTNINFDFHNRWLILMLNPWLTINTTSVLLAWRSLGTKSHRFEGNQAPFNYGPLPNMSLTIISPSTIFFEPVHPTLRICQIHIAGF